MPGTYQYEPGNIAEYGKDRMRFELGDVMVEGKEKTCALCDEEYNAVIPEKVPTAMYEDLKKDLKASAASAEAILPLAENPETGRVTPPYFYAGMMSHEETEGEDI